MTARPLILVTNDDGVHATGIRHLQKALEEIADLVVVAPATEQSAVSLSITIRRPLIIEKIARSSTTIPIWSVNGTPADCVKLALNVILPRPPHLIVSGINRGNNAGRNVLYSGTIAGVIEGLMHQIPGIAFSISDYFNPSYAEIESYIPLVTQYVLEHPLPMGTFLNVNFPEQIEKGIKGIRFAKQGKEYWAENPELRKHPVEGLDYYWLGAKLAQFDEDEDSDIAYLREGYVAATPIHISDLTHYEYLKQQQHHFETFINQNKDFMTLLYRESSPC